MCFGFLSLRKNWVCLAKITFMFPLPYPTAEEFSLIPHFRLRGELLAAHAGFVLQNHFRCPGNIIFIWAG